MEGPMTNNGSDMKRKELADLIEHLLELHRLQRARVDWLRNGDGNSKKIPTICLSQKEHNLMKWLTDDQWEWLEGTDMLNPMIENYFAHPFSSEFTNTDLGFLEKFSREFINKWMNNCFLYGGLSEAHYFQYRRYQGPRPRRFACNFLHIKKKKLLGSPGGDKLEADNGGVEWHHSSLNSKDAC